MLNWFSGLLSLSLTLSLISGALLGCDGKARDLAKGSPLGDAVIGDGDGERTDGSNFGQIYSVTTVVESTSDISGWTMADMPFTGPVRQLGVNATDSQWPFEFTFTYPSNNYKLGEAHLVLVSQRDSSDTEGIFIDGVMTGRPPGSLLNGTTSQVPYRYYSCPSGCSGPTIPSTPANRYVMDWLLTHYKVGTYNSFDLNISDLLTPTPLTPLTVVNDGKVRVVTGDDLAVATDGTLFSRPLLILNGFTVSKQALSCSTSPTYRFVNTYIHNDGNSIGSPAFTGTVYSPVQSYGTAGTSGNTVEFFFDPVLPRLNSLNDLNLNAARLSMIVQRGSVGASAIVINGVGISQTGFDRNLATSEVETWDDTSGVNVAWESFLSTIPTTGSAVVSLDLVNLLGASRVKTLLNQGKMNIAISGALARVYGQRATAQRGYGTLANGPELYLQGDYTVPLCTIPNDPSSPLNDSSPTLGSCDLDETSPAVSSMQAVSITANSATIQWLSDEPSDSQVSYGLTGPTATTTLGTTLVSFHSVELSGLQPYKYYQYTVSSRDACGNVTTGPIRTFRTLR